MELEDEDQELYMKGYNLLTYKPVIYAANVSEGDLADDAQSNPHVQRVRSTQRRQKAKYLLFVQKLNRKFLNWKKMRKRVPGRSGNQTVRSGKTDRGKLPYFRTLKLSDSRRR